MNAFTIFIDKNNFKIHLFLNYFGIFISEFPLYSMNLKYSYIIHEYS